MTVGYSSLFALRFEVSCKTGEGLAEWYDWLRARVKEI
jgi:hypothetical protein